VAAATLSIQLILAAGLLHISARWAIATAANIEAAKIFPPRTPNSLILLGISTPRLHNPLSSFANTRTPP
jgi:hypothetical protein